jgi:hypothetical protein
MLRDFAFPERWLMGDECKKWQGVKHGGEDCIVSIGMQPSIRCSSMAEMLLKLVECIYLRD